MNDPNLTLLIIGFIVMAFVCFALGWDVAETRERKAKSHLDRNLKLAIKQKHELTTWINQNWPNEFEAYQKGHAEGYQQGILQASDMEDQT
jgi:hypothetical protein